MENKKMQTRVRGIITILEQCYPDARTALNFTSPLELLAATMLSAQCTDERVNQVTRKLFQKYRSARDYAEAEIGELEQDIRPTGFFRNKAKALKACCTSLGENFGGEVPNRLDALVTLPGIGRKTANLILGEAFGIPGIVVDTHVLRLSQRIGLTRNKDAVKVEFDLMEIVPQNAWTRFSNLLILHGRSVCTARKPAHDRCGIVKLCDEGKAPA